MKEIRLVTEPKRTSRIDVPVEGKLGKFVTHLDHTSTKIVFMIRHAD
jgi:hypothetical protein